MCESSFRSPQAPNAPEPPDNAFRLRFLFHCCYFVHLDVCAERNSILMHLNGFQQRLVDLITGLWLWLWLWLWPRFRFGLGP